jgi:hypothetical protein
MLVLAYDASQNGGEYRLVVGRVKTLHDLRRLEGDAAVIQGGAEISVDYDALAQLASPSAEAVAAATTRSAGRTVDFAYFMADGIIHAEDFDSLAMGTLYYNLERAHLFFEALNAPLYNLDVQYGATYERGRAGALAPVTDTLVWDPVSRRMIVPRASGLAGLPLEMNLGVVAHEYAHAVFGTRFDSGDALPWLQRKAWAEPAKYARAVRLEASFGEALADTFGALVSTDPAFMRKSLPAITEARRLDPPEPRCITPAMEAALEADGAYDPYPLGSVVAAALWTSVATAGDRRSAFARGLVDAMTELGAAFKEKDAAVTLADAANALVKTVNADLKPRTCGLLQDRLGLEPADLPTCGAEIRAPDRRCP